MTKSLEIGAQSSAEFALKIMEQREPSKGEFFIFVSDNEEKVFEALKVKITYITKSL
jgi:hypothetical protein